MKGRGEAGISRGGHGRGSWSSSSHSGPGAGACGGPAISVPYQPRRYGWAPDAPYRPAAIGRSAPDTGTAQERRERLARERSEAFARRLRKSGGVRKKKGGRIGNPVPIRPEEFRDRLADADEKLVEELQHPLAWHKHEEMGAHPRAEECDPDFEPQPEEIDADKLFMRQRGFKFCFTWDEWCFLHETKNAIHDVHESCRKEEEKKKRELREAQSRDAFREWVKRKSLQQSKEAGDDFREELSPTISPQKTARTYTPSTWKEDKEVMRTLRSARLASQKKAEKYSKVNLDGEKKEASEAAYRNWLRRKQQQKQDEQRLQEQVRSVLQSMKEAEPSKWDKKDVVNCYTYASRALKSKDQEQRQAFIQRMRELSREADEGLHLY